MAEITQLCVRQEPDAIADDFIKIISPHFPSPEKGNSRIQVILDYEINHANPWGDFCKITIETE